MMALKSALYTGTMLHRRFKPRQHRLSYRVYWTLLDLDELATVSNRLRLFSWNRFNLFSFISADYASGNAEPLRAQVERHLRTAGIDLAGGAILLLTMPRVLGYAFNPLNIYFCHRNDDSLAAILYEVNNTFGERHSYLIPLTVEAGQTVQQSCEKCFYVSPFLDMKLTYEFVVATPGETVSVTVKGSDSDGPIITASLRGTRRELTDGVLLRTFVSYPLLTLKVIAAIHWEALKIWLKGVRLQNRPAAPASPVTIVHPVLRSNQT
jgi:DUF1365 family protein